MLSKSRLATVQDHLLLLPSKAQAQSNCESRSHLHKYQTQSRRGHKQTLLFSDNLQAMQELLILVSQGNRPAFHHFFKQMDPQSHPIN